MNSAGRNTAGLSSLALGSREYVLEKNMLPVLE
jgi:hypothetical protein